MGYIQVSSRSVIVPLSAASCVKAVERFCQQAFPSAQSYRAWNGRVNVNITLGEGAGAYFVFETRGYTAAGTAPGSGTEYARIQIMGNFSGYNIGNDKPARDMCEQFFKTIVNSLTQAMNELTGNGPFQPSTRAPKTGTPPARPGIA